jgi:hypothetical protein
MRKASFFVLFILILAATVAVLVMMESMTGSPHIAFWCGLVFFALCFALLVRMASGMERSSQPPSA